MAVYAATWSIHVVTLPVHILHVVWQTVHDYSRCGGTSWERVRTQLASNMSPLLLVLKSFWLAERANTLKYVFLPAWGIMALHFLGDKTEDVNKGLTGSTVLCPGGLANVTYHTVVEAKTDRKRSKTCGDHEHNEFCPSGVRWIDRFEDQRVLLIFAMITFPFLAVLIRDLYTEGCKNIWLVSLSCLVLEDAVSVDFYQNLNPICRRFTQNSYHNTNMSRSRGRWSSGRFIQKKEKMHTKIFVEFQNDF